MTKILEGNIIKKANTKQKYTKEQINQLRKCSAANEDGHYYFMENFGHLKHTSKGRVLFKPFDYQKRLIDNYHNYRFSINMLGRQMGKALSEDTPILTSIGFKTMGDIAVGDRVFSEHGEEIEVINKTLRQDNRKTYKVIFAHGEEIVADSNHEWEVYDSKLRKTKIFTTEQMIHRLDVNKRNDQSLRIKINGPLQFEKKDVPIDPYALGVWLGDGFSISNKITTHVDDYNQYVKFMNLSEGILRKGSDTCIDFKILDIDNNVLKEEELYKNKHIPNLYIYNNIHTRLEILRGLMDTDGTVEKNGVCRFYQSDYEFIKSVRILLSTLGIKSTLRSKETIGKTAYTLCFVCNEFDVFKLPRKLERQYKNKSHTKNKNFYIKSIESCDSKPVYCIEVDNPTHLFLAGETLIPTHNCVSSDTEMKIRHKKTGEEKQISFEDFLEMVKK